MSGRTKLYQKPGSALIQGHSKMEVPGWRVWLWGLVVGFALTCVAVYVLTVLISETSAEGAVSDVILGTVGTVLVAGSPGLLAGAGLGTVLGRGMGWRSPAVAAGLVATMFALGTIGVAQYVLGLSLMG